MVQYLRCFRNQKPGTRPMTHCDEYLHIKLLGQKKKNTVWHTTSLQCHFDEQICNEEVGKRNVAVCGWWRELELEAQQHWQVWEKSSVDRRAWHWAVRWYAEAWNSYRLCPWTCCPATWMPWLWATTRGPRWRTPHSLECTSSKDPHGPCWPRRPCWYLWSVLQLRHMLVSMVHAASRRLCQDLRSLWVFVVCAAFGGLVNVCGLCFCQRPGGCMCSILPSWGHVDIQGPCSHQWPY